MMKLPSLINGNLLVRLPEAKYLSVINKRIAFIRESKDMGHLLLLILLFVFVISSAGQAGAVDSLKLARLLERGRETNSDALIVIQNGKVLAEEYYGKPKGAVY